uniref:Cilia- and flagella-associated protein 206 n=1 Tax=Timema monikensis TaxID=170555 RepID=A0A7R9EK48_9NEOP|nr:unnamed protein product [Timema monikensis]
MLITGRQQEVYLRKLLSEVELSRCSLDELLVRLKKRLLQIHDTVRFRTAIPTIQVYVMDHTDNEVLKMMLGDAEVLTDADRLEASMGQTIHRRKTINCGVVDPSVVADFDRIPLQYLGFCAWTFVEGRGALIPANQNMGVLRWNGNYYAFSSPDAAYQFDQDPEKSCRKLFSNHNSTQTRVTRPSPAKLGHPILHILCHTDGYIKAAANLARVHPELINLLQLHEQMVASRSLGE